MGLRLGKDQDLSAPLMLFDHDLGFLKNEITLNLSFAFNSDRLESMECITQ